MIPRYFFEKVLKNGIEIDFVEVVLDPEIAAEMLIFGANFQIVERGHFDSRERLLSFEHFPKDAQNPRRIALVRFKTEVKPGEDVLPIFKEFNITPATLIDILTINLQHPGVVDESPIVALGDMKQVGGEKHAPAISGKSDCRYLNMMFCLDDVPRNVRYAGVITCY